MNINVWDFTNYFFNEFLVSIVIGYSKKKTEDPSKKIDNFNLKSFDINENNANLEYNEEQKLNDDLDKKFFN